MFFFREQDVIIKFKNGVAKAPLSYANADQDAYYELDETDCRTYLYFSLLPYNMHVGGSIYANSTIAAADLDFSLDLFSIDQTVFFLCFDHQEHCIWGVKSMAVDSLLDGLYFLSV
jgi:hypothetical protein